MFSFTGARLDMNSWKRHSGGVRRTLAAALTVSLLSMTAQAAPTAPSETGADTSSADANNDRLGLLPTAQSLKQNQFLFNDYELFLLQIGWGATDRLQVSFLTSFPLAGVPFWGILSGKYRYFDSSSVKLAALGTFTFIPSFDSHTFTLATVGHAATFCLDSACDNELNATGIFNLQFGSTGESGRTQAVVVGYFGGGAAIRASRHIKLIAEVSTGGASTTASFVAIPGGLITYGLRFFGTDIAADLLLVRPFATSGSVGDFPFPLGIPMLNFSYRWGAGT